MDLLLLPLACRSGDCPCLREGQIETPKKLLRILRMRSSWQWLGEAAMMERAWAPPSMA
jgi:hypothetical protein